eukprot:CAMPEP_0194254772 /NCGR_PEP_ID=MMETSP0158-20130606/32857_1 /TAXON_ID=33649 /ORGANISM="Thalassionema nitzschioides, Strain L26-B" /LENGTH=59 /DNA_ID=CAMNT_0038992927 /DNA_START=64 /DNA_END=239 /DNA_ORIENTATION=+
MPMLVEREQEMRAMVEMRLQEGLKSRWQSSLIYREWFKAMNTTFSDDEISESKASYTPS